MAWIPFDASLNSFISFFYILPPPLPSFPFWKAIFYGNKFYKVLTMIKRLRGLKRVGDQRDSLFFFFNPRAASCTSRNKRPTTGNVIWKRKLFFSFIEKWKAKSFLCCFSKFAQAFIPSTFYVDKKTKKTIVWIIIVVGAKSVIKNNRKRIILWASFFPSCSTFCFHPLLILNKRNASIFAAFWLRVFWGRNVDALKDWNWSESDAKLTLKVFKVLLVCFFLFLF